MTGNSSAGAPRSRFTRPTTEPRRPADTCADDSTPFAILPTLFETPQVARKLFIRTFGCQMNEYDSDRMADVLEAAEGLTRTDRAEDADVILFNTCSVREKAQERVFHDLGRVRALKAARPDVVIGVGGCVASQEGAAIVRRAPYVDVVFGPQTLHRLPDLIRARRQTGTPQVDVTFPEIEKFDRLPPPRVEGASAFVSIMEGCSKYCAFCVVPYTRGEEVSRPFDSVLTEIADLADQGVREITLLGQNVNAYRGALGDAARSRASDSLLVIGRDVADLAMLLEYAADVPGIERLRFTTSHPKEMSKRLIDAFATNDKLVSHLHLPVQSGSDRVLAAMKRGYTVLEYKSIVRRLRAARPALSLSSDFIVGFPGETEEDFEATLRLCESTRFDGAFSFAYSPRPGTPAAELCGQVPDDVKQRRLMRLQSLLDNAYRHYSEAMVGTRQRVLVTGRAAKNPREMAARTDNNRVVNFAGDASSIDTYVDVDITAALPHSLRGEIPLAQR
jgi:tRNA-2-methylthio-N6-dimethylallyladenosine synthase